MTLDVYSERHRKVLAELLRGLQDAGRISSDPLVEAPVAVVLTAMDRLPLKWLFEGAAALLR